MNKNGLLIFMSKYILFKQYYLLSISTNKLIIIFKFSAKSSFPNLITQYIKYIQRNFKRHIKYDFYTYITDWKCNPQMTLTCKKEVIKINNVIIAMYTIKHKII